MRARIFLAMSFAVFAVAACGGSEELGDDFPEQDSGGDFFDDDGGVGTGIFDASAFSDGGVFGFGDAGFGSDAGFGGDGGRHHRDGGVGGFDGGISVFDSGTSLPPDSGPQGPRDAGTLSGALLRDANGVVLGEIVSIQSEGAVFTIVTSADYVVEINFDGTFAPPGPGDLLYSASNCGGAVYLEGSTSQGELLGSTVVYSSNRGLMIPAGPLTSGAATSTPVSWSSVGDPCVNGASSGFYGWPLVATTAASIGLPDTIAAPLSYP